MSDPIVEAMCDALLAVYGLGRTASMSLTEARGEVRAQAEAVIHELRDIGIELIDKETDAFYE